MVAFTKMGLAASALLSSAIAHPGDSHEQKMHEAMRNHATAYKAKSALDACASDSQHQALMARNVQRRAEQAEALRQKRGINVSSKKLRRDLATLEAFEAVNHNMTGKLNYDPNTPVFLIFGANTSSIVTPEITDGPYYVTGEAIRKNVKEEQYSDGVDLYLEVQYIDINNCQPVPGIYVDTWGANATGVYSGISTDGNYAADGYDSTYLRGIQPTDKDGVASFETIFPGHYEGRATHTHILAHMNVTVFPNNTISSTNNITHIGQVFYPESLRSAVEAIEPYASNTQAVTSNDDDMWSIVQADTYYDPFPEFIYLGNDVSDGLMAWIQIGVNTSANYIDGDYYSVAAQLWADGGHVNSDSSFGGGGEMGGNGTMNGTGSAMPSGSAVPSGAPSS
ncbi:aromatic compound dioxygenase [Hortaea werneckii]|nr:aromatic compound dioxygenase [Hortaea werneckii]